MLASFPTLIPSVFFPFDFPRSCTSREVWIVNWWRDRTMAWFRKTYCEPSEVNISGVILEVANTLCAAPQFDDVADATVRLAFLKGVCFVHWL